MGDFKMCLFFYFISYILLPLNITYTTLKSNFILRIMMNGFPILLFNDVYFMLELVVSEIHILVLKLSSKRHKYTVNETC